MYIVSLSTLLTLCQCVFVCLQHEQEYRTNKSKKKQRKDKTKAPAKVRMHLDEFVGRDEVTVYEDENGVLHRQPVRYCSCQPAS